jgi:hypothetical protein
VDVEAGTARCSQDVRPVGCAGRSLPETTGVDKEEVFLFISTGGGVHCPPP